MITTAYLPDRYAGDDATAAFAATNPYFAASDLVVNLRDDTAGTDVLQVLGTDYTASTPSPIPGTGTVTFTTAPPSGQTVIIERATPLTQQIDYVEGDSFPAASHEEGLDRGLAHDQERNEDMERTPKFLATDPVASRGDFPDSVTRASKYGGYSAAGVPVALDPPVDTSALSVWGAVWALLADAAAGRAELGVTKLDAGAIGSRPAANVFGEGIWYATDTHRAYYSNATAWFEITLEHFAQASLPAAATAGRKFLDTDRYQPWYDDGSNLQAIRHFPTWHIKGLGVSYINATTFEVQPGGARDYGDVTNLILAAALQKTVNVAGAWSAGAAGNAFTVAAPAAPGWHRVGIIGKDDGATDVGCDTSSTFVNLLAESGYDWYRRIGWVYLDVIQRLYSSYMEDDETTYWNVPRTGLADGGDVARAGVQVALGFVPPNCHFKGNVSIVNLAGEIIFLEGGQTCAAPTATVTPVAHSVTDKVGPLSGRTDAQKRIYIYADDTCTLNIDIHSWRDNRHGA